MSFLVFAALGTVWTLSSPLMSPPDEPAHVVKAVATVKGDLQGRTTVVRSDDPDVVSGTFTSYDQTKTIEDLGIKVSCYAFETNVPAGCMEPHLLDGTPAVVSTQMGGYPPVYYALVGWPYRVLHVGEALLAMRFLAVLICAALMATGLDAALDLARPAGVIAGVVLALTPMAFFLAGAINPSGMEVAAAFGLWLSTLALVRSAGRPTARQLIRVAVCAALLAWSRPLSPVFVVLIVGAVVVAAAPAGRLGELWSDRRTRLAALAAGGVVLLATAYILTSGAFGSFTGHAQPGLTHLEAATHSLGRTRALLVEGIGRFGWSDTMLPRWMPDLWLVGIAALVALAMVVGTWRQRLSILAVAVGMVAIQVTSEALKAPDLGYIWQARYSMPGMVGVPLLSGWVIGTSDRLTRRSLVRIVAAATVVAGIGMVTAHAIWMRRNIVGADHPVLSYLSGTGWQPPFSAWFLGLAMLVVTIGYAGWLNVLARGTGDRISDRDGRPVEPVPVR